MRQLAQLSKTVTISLSNVDLYIHFIEDSPMVTESGGLCPDNLIIISGVDLNVRPH